MTAATAQHGRLGAVVRPVVLALAPPAPGLCEGAAPPCLESVGGARLIERLLDTLHQAGLTSPVVITTAEAAPALRSALAGRARVLGSRGGRRGALRLALAETEEDLLLVQDAERALTPVAVVAAVLDAFDAEVDATLPVIAMTDSIKAVHEHGLRNVDRSSLAGLQSPRLLRRALLDRALAQPDRTGLEGSAGPGSPAADGPSAHGPSAHGSITHGSVAPGPAERGGSTERFDEMLAVLDVGGRVRTVPGSQSGFAVQDRLTLWRAQIALGLARDTSHRRGLARRS